jgi:hypothetical protein
MNKSKSIGISSLNFYIIFIASFIFVPIVGLFNSYIFHEQNVYLYSVILILYCAYNSRRIAKSFFKSATPYMFLMLVIYSIFTAVPVPEFSYNTYLITLFCYFLFFTMGVLLFYRKEYMTDLIWCFCFMYLILYVAKISLDIQAAIEGTNLSSGIVVCTLFPFVLINLRKYTINYRRYSYVILFFLVFWCALIGARAVTLGVVSFGITYFFWPLITKYQFFYVLYFISFLIAISLGVFYYIFYLNNPDFTPFGDSGIGILSKRIGTRLAIWVHLVEVILQGDWLWGHGSNLKTSDLIPLSYLDFNENRKNLSSHSMIFETIYRVGVFGLSLFFLIIFSIWSFLWKSRKSNLTRIVCSTIMMLIPICYSSTFLVFSDFHLRCAFIWVLLGFGYGHTFVYSRQSITQAKCPV